MNPHATAAAATSAKPRSNGRPTREAARRRHDELLEQSLDLFAKTGFDNTSIDTIAASLRMAKRTIYSLYDDKETLFQACVKRAIEEHLDSMNAFSECQADDLQTTLLNVAQLRAKHALSEKGIRIRRIVHSESARFPEILRCYEDGSQPAIKYLSHLFYRHLSDRHDLTVDEIEFMAMSFLSMVSTPIRMVIIGKEHDPEWVELYIERSVKLFLSGISSYNR